MKTSEILRLLKQRHADPPGAYVFFTEFTMTMGRQERRADAIAFSLFRSHGREISGFEIKVDRADWLRELQDPSKAEAVSRFCDRWWIVTPAAEIVRRDELPANWGLMTVRKNGQLAISVRAPKLEAEPVSPEFIARLIRKVRAAYVSIEEVETLVRRQLDERLFNARRTDIEKISKIEEELASLKWLVKDFEKRSGLKVESWEAGRIGDAVREHLAKSRDLSDAEGQLRRILRDAESATHQIRRIIERAGYKIEQPTTATADDDEVGPISPF